mgnify:CR=1 FL=1
MFEIEVTNNRASTKRGELLTKGHIGMENDKYKWEIKKFKIPLEAVTT